MKSIDLPPTTPSQFHLPVLPNSPISPVPPPGTLLNDGFFSDYLSSSSITCDNEQNTLSQKFQFPREANQENDSTSHLHSDRVIYSHSSSSSSSWNQIEPKYSRYPKPREKTVFSHHLAQSCADIIIGFLSPRDRYFNLACVSVGFAEMVLRFSYGANGYLLGGFIGTPEEDKCFLKPRKKKEANTESRAANTPGGHVLLIHDER